MIAEGDRGQRFKPTRAGIINLWDYVDEVFHFADGRLVLRGHNGAGKTKALEVLFPFVLDGRTDPRRLDPFSGENRTMKENLLYRGNEAGYGYVWMEFTRVVEDGVRERVTIGVGMQARKHKEGVTPWFFVTDGAVGEDFSLVVDQRPLTYQGLLAVLGPERVTQKGREYRELVDRRLFELGTERYEQMLSLVLTLRKPQLSKDLDPDKLSDVLSRGLRPLDDDLLGQVAKSFDDLELAQRELDQLVAADEALQAFVTLYRGHVKAVARHRVDQVRAAGESVERRQGELDNKQKAFADARGDEARATKALAGTKAALVGARTRKEALIESPAYKAVKELESKRSHLQTAQGTVTKSERAIGTLKASVDELREKAAGAELALSMARQDVVTFGSKLLSATLASGVAWSSDDNEGAADDVKTRITARLGARRVDVLVVRKHLGLVDEAERQAVTADVQLQQARDRVAAAEERQRTAEGTAERARAAVIEALRGWAAVRPAGILASDDVDAMIEAVASLGEPGASTLRELLNARLATSVERVAREIDELERRIDVLDRRDVELVAQRDTIRDEKDDAPAPVLARPTDRTSRPGAPLWRLVRFRDDVGAREQAGIEAALEAAGILDAWVMPSAETNTGGLLDAFLVLRSRLGIAGTLADVLLAEDQSCVSAERIEDLLRSIAYPLDTSAEVTVTEDGGYRIGLLAGTYYTDSARYIGATARAAHRQRKIELIERERAELAATRLTVAAELDGARARQEAYVTAASALPSTIAIAEAVRAIDTARGAVRAERENENVALDALNRWRREANDRRLVLRREAANRSMPTEADGITAIEASLDDAEDHGDNLVSTRARTDEREAESKEWSKQHSSRAGELTVGEDDHRGFVVTRDRLATELETLQANVGADEEALQLELADIAEQLAKLDQDEKVQTTAANTAIEGRAGAERDVGTAKIAVDEAESAHSATMSALQPLASADLAALLELDSALVSAVAVDGPTSPESLALFGALEAKTRGVSGSEDRRKTAMSQMSTSLGELGARLGAYYRPAWRLEEDIIRVTIADDEGENSAAVFASKLAVRRQEQQALLTVREREVFENSLLSSMCRQLNARTTSARDLVRQMDRAMRERKMSSGKTVGVSWLLGDGLTGEQRKVVGYLEYDPTNLAAEQLDELRVHFLHQVRAARQAQGNRSYRDILATVLDYRVWRRFVLHLVDANGQQDTLTKARHSKLSGGEKAASLHIPLFAAAHAQFSSARATCPRLVALDEAFAGIDSQGKPELMSLSVEFDLDLFMTGFDLWVTFPGVPSAAHYDLVHVPTENTVSTMLLLWDGSEIVEGERAESMIRSASGR